MQTLVGGRTWPWLLVVCRTLPQGNGHKEGWADARAGQELEWGAGDWLAGAEGTIWASVSGLLLPILSSGFDHHGKDYKMTGMQVGKWGQDVQPAHQRKDLGFKRKACTEPSGPDRNTQKIPAPPGRPTLRAASHTGSSLSAKGSCLPLGTPAFL